MFKSTELAKMKLKLLDSVSGVDREKEVLYNPTSVEYDKTIGWSSNRKTAKIQDKKVYYDAYSQSNDEREMSFKLFFDYTMHSDKKFITDFQFFEKITNPVVKDNNKMRPPRLAILWGSESSLYLDNAVITKIGWEYEFFAKNGDVLRASANISLRQVIPFEIGTSSFGGKKVGQ
ncbi:MAG: hypothetical protein JXQ76_08800 [Campylobacterales bacterium]|nr:hypothetical protein [Campylobacterales bacterium]